MNFNAEKHQLKIPPYIVINSLHRKHNTLRGGLCLRCIPALQQLDLPPLPQRLHPSPGARVLCGGEAVALLESCPGWPSSLMPTVDGWQAQVDFRALCPQEKPGMEHLQMATLRAREKRGGFTRSSGVGFCGPSSPASRVPAAPTPTPPPPGGGRSTLTPLS